MRHFIRSILCVLVCLALVAPGAGQDVPKPPAAPTKEQLPELLGYLSTNVPELRSQAEARVQLVAKAHFETLVSLLPGLEQRGREVLLNILANTDSDGRVALCVNTLCRRDALRRERVIAATALRTADEAKVLVVLREHLKREDLSLFERVQCCRMLGELRGDDARLMAERELASAQPGSLLEFFAEDALLRAVLVAPLGEPFWKRYQRRHAAAPVVELAVLQEALDNLAQPLASQRIEAEITLTEIVGRDMRLMLALAGSNRPEQATFGLAALKRQTGNRMTLPTLAVMLDIALAAEQTVALLAVDVAIAGTPPTPADLDALRPVCGAEAINRLEAVLEGLTASGNLADLRRQRARAEALLVPLLRRNGTTQDETAKAVAQLEAITTKLQELEKRWRGGWRREFEREILGLPRQ